MEMNPLRREGVLKVKRCIKQRQVGMVCACVCGCRKHNKLMTSVSAVLKAVGKRLNEEEVTLVISVKMIHVYRTEVCK